MDGGKVMLLPSTYDSVKGLLIVSILPFFLLVKIFPTLEFCQDLTEVHTTQLESTFLSVTYMFLST